MGRDGHRAEADACLPPDGLEGVDGNGLQEAHPFLTRGRGFPPLNLKILHPTFQKKWREGFSVTDSLCSLHFAEALAGDASKVLVFLLTLLPIF